MSLYPAATALKCFDPSLQPRHAMLHGYSSPLFIAHKDMTKLLFHPNTMQEILNGTSTGGTTEVNTQYCVRLKVPDGARSFCLYWYAQILLSASTGVVDTITATLASAQLVRISVLGRMPLSRAGYSYSAVDAGLTNAATIDNLGLWRTIGQITSVAGSGSAITILGTTGGYGADQMAVSHEVGLRRICIGHISGPRGFSQGFGTPFMDRTTFSLAGVPHNDNQFGIPTMGSDEIVVVPYAQSTTSTLAFGATGTSISSVEFMACAATFHS